MTAFRDSLALMLRARFPILYIESFEEQRVLAEIRSVATSGDVVRTPRPVFTWSATAGVIGPEATGAGSTSEAVAALQWFRRHEQPALLVMCDLHAYLGDDRRPADPTLIRTLRELSTELQSGTVARTLVIVSPVLRIPDEIEKDVTLIDFPLPDENEIREVLDDMIEANRSSGRIRIEVDEVGRERLAKAALGLTLNEATNAFARAMVNDGVLDADDVH